VELRQPSIQLKPGNQTEHFFSIVGLNLVFKLKIILIPINKPQMGILFNSASYFENVRQGQSIFKFGKKIK
jgi:ABC-type uncharacterized transport system YnjBCD ATPase subunit